MRTPRYLGALLLCVAGVAFAADEPLRQADSPTTVNDKLLLIASQVHTGHMACELGNSVTVAPDPQVLGNFVLQMHKTSYHMTPVVTSTGAVRLEDAKAGAMWLQLPNKSMLMNSKIGQRMADECHSPSQLAVAAAMKVSPPPSLLDEPALARK